MDDDANIRLLVESYLQNAGFETVGLGSAEEAWELWQHDKPRLWVLDIMLPGMDGYEFCRRIRAQAEVPIIIISARDEEVDKIMGIELGSDDYLTKPFSPRELVARVKRLLHRWELVQQEIGAATQSAQTGAAQINTAQTMGASTVLASRPDTGKPEVAPVPLQIVDRRAVWHGSFVSVTPKELQLLEYMLAHVNRACSREQLLDMVWGDGYFGTDRSVDHVIKRLRKKFPGLAIDTVWNFGYRLRLAPADPKPKSAVSTGSSGAGTPTTGAL